MKFLLFFFSLLVRKKLLVLVYSYLPSIGPFDGFNNAVNYNKGSLNVLISKHSFTNKNCFFRWYLLIYPVRVSRHWPKLNKQYQQQQQHQILVNEDFSYISCLINFTFWLCLPCKEYFKVINSQLKQFDLYFIQINLQNITPFIEFYEGMIKRI